MASALSSLRLHGLLLVAPAVGLAVGAVLPRSLDLLSRVAVGWETALAVYVLASFWRMARNNDLAAIRRRAAALDEVGLAVLPVSLAAAVASLALVVIEASGAATSQGALLALAGVALSWLFVHLIFALHYAHAFYAPAEKGDAGGLLFPAESEPDYWDFLHFALIIGVASQTADIQIAGRSLRRVSTVHSVTAFVFNTVLLALAVNLAVSLLGRGG